MATKTDKVSYHVEGNFALDQWYREAMLNANDPVFSMAKKFALTECVWPLVGTPLGWKTIG